MEDKTLYFECYSGISGDMIISSLLDLGVDQDYLVKTLAKLPLGDYKIKIGSRDKCGIKAKSFEVIYEEEHHVHRNINDIEEIINKAKLKPEIHNLSKEIFEKIAVAESFVHGVDINEIHFHEVGAVDSIVDIVGAATCIDYLGIKDIRFSTIYLGSGHQKCAHGTLPVPVPAVAKILENSDLNIKITDIKGEMVTPTGASIASTLKSSRENIDNYQIEKIGVGSGVKDFDHANVLRTYILKKNKK